MWHFWLFFWILLAVVIILMYCINFYEEGTGVVALAA